jgi:predicted ATPase
VDWGTVGWIPAEQLSEGTLLAIGLTTILRFRPPRLVLLDDLDKALHPVAQRDLVQMIRRLADRARNVQIVATAHSPFVLDALKPEVVLVVGSDSPGSSRVCRLDKHPAWEKKGQYLAAGEFWSAIGEGWVAETPR